MDDEKHGDQPPTSHPQDPLTPSSVKPAIETNEVPQEPRDVATANQDPTKELKREFRIFEKASLAINVGLAIIGIIALCVYHGQLTVMQRQLDQMEADGRPWIKIIDIGVIDPTSDFPALSFIKMPWVRRLDNGKPQNFTQPAVNISFTITIKNIGKGVAREVFLTPVIRFEQPNSTQILGRDEKGVCTEATRHNPGVPFSWSSVFPEEIRTAKIQTVGYYDERMYSHPDRNGDWISGIVFGCVSYQPEREYLTSAVFYITGDKDRFLEVGKPLKSERLHLLRDEHYEYAQ